MNTFIYLECPKCGGCENHNFLEGITKLLCSYCLEPFGVKMKRITLVEKGKTQIDLTADVFPLFQSIKIAA